MDRGQLIVICGCMFAGKTGRLIQHLRSAANTQHVRAFKHCLDRRYDAARLATHDGQIFDAQPVADVAELEARANHADVIGVDELHFFDVNLVDLVARWRSAGRTIILAGLDHDAWGQEFPVARRLKATADEVELRTVPCSVCGKPARYSQRITPLRNADMVGGPGDYDPRCAAHFVPLDTPAPVYQP